MTNNEIKKKLSKLTKETLIGILAICVERMIDEPEDFLDEIEISDRNLRARNRLKKMGWEKAEILK